MKEIELRKHLICSLCGKKVGESGVPMFWIMSIERLGIKMDAVQRSTGLAMMLGSATLGMVMDPDEDMTMPLMDKKTLTVCENCCTATTCIAALAEAEPLTEGK